MVAANLKVDETFEVQQGEPARSSKKASPAEDCTSPPHPFDSHLRIDCYGRLSSQEPLMQTSIDRNHMSRRFAERICKQQINGFRLIRGRYGRFGQSTLGIEIS